MMRVNSPGHPLRCREAMTFSSKHVERRVSPLGLRPTPWLAALAGERTRTETREGAAQVMRRIIEWVEITPRPARGQYEVKLAGQLAQLLVAAGKGTPAERSATVLTAKVVAAEGLNRRPRDYDSEGRTGQNSQNLNVYRRFPLGM